MTNETQTSEYADAELAALARETLGNAMLGKPAPEKSTTSQVSSQAGDKVVGDGGSSSSANQQAGDGTTSSDGNDPLAEMSVDEILKHPKLGPLVQSRIDKTIATQVQVRVPQEVNKILPNLRAEVEQASLAEYLESLGADERARVLAGDEDVAAAWGRIQASKAERANTPPNDGAAQVHAYHAVIQTWNQVIADANLPDEVRATLAPENFAAQPNGIVLWGAAIQKALLESEVAKRLPDEIKAAQEAEQNNKRAVAPRRPGVTPPGQGKAPVLQVGEAKTNDLWEQAFAGQRK